MSSNMALWSCSQEDQRHLQSHQLGFGDEKDVTPHPDSAGKCSVRLRHLGKAGAMVAGMLHVASCVPVNVSSPFAETAFYSFHGIVRKFHFNMESFLSAFVTFLPCLEAPLDQGLHLTPLSLPSNIWLILLHVLGNY